MSKTVKRNVDHDRLSANLLRRFEQHMMMMMVLCETSYRDSKYGTRATEQLLDQLRKSSDDIMDEVADFLKIAQMGSKLSKLEKTVKTKSNNTSATILERLKSKLTRFHELLFKEIEQTRNGSVDASKSVQSARDSQELKDLRIRERDNVQQEFTDEFCETMASTSIRTSVSNVFSKEKKEPAYVQCVNGLNAGFQAYLANIQIYNRGVFAMDASQWGPQASRDDGSDVGKVIPGDWRTAPAMLASAIAKWVLVSV
jgi:hypothetical protein